MPWNPEIYNQFKNIRYQPFFDLSDMISDDNLKNAIDIGCGTGEQTSILSQKFKNTSFVGIDSSAEMLAEGKKYEKNNLHFQLQTVEDFISSDSQKWDLIFSNAALQWIDKHEDLFPNLIAKLSDNGQFAVQMPSQTENVLNKIVLKLAKEEPFAGFLNNWKRESPVLSLDQYSQILFENGLQDIQILQKVYPIIANDSEKLFEFISGSTLIPYLERLTDEQQVLFVSEFKKRINETFKSYPAIYSFKRLLLYGKK